MFYLRLFLDLQYLVERYLAGDTDTAYDPLAETMYIVYGAPGRDAVRWIERIAP